ncbi:MAG: hypothetical protein ACK558_14100, partial [Pseudomonadota bacterium]
SAAAFWGIGTAFSKTYAVAKEGSTNMVEVVFRREASGSAVARIAAHAGAGGALADLQGGNFGSGFLSAGVTKWLSPAVSSIGMGDGERSFADLAAQTVASATIGGTASAITGNGFGSGAQTGAFQYLFNQAAQSAASAASAGPRAASIPGRVPSYLGPAAAAGGFGVFAMINPTIVGDASLSSAMAERGYLIQLYRVVGPTELASIFSTTPPQFAPGPSGWGEKQFWLSYNDAEWFAGAEAQYLPGRALIPRAMVSTLVTRSTLALAVPFSDAGHAAVSFGPTAFPALNTDAARFGVFLLKSYPPK